MKKRFPTRLVGGSQAMMASLGYRYHCVEDGRPCYHRAWNDQPFPRFHAYVAEEGGWIEIELHVDALDPILHQGNHHQPWAYAGGRVNEEMERITNTLNGTAPLPHVAGSERRARKNHPARKIKNLIDLLFF
ncbi:hypothetical protein FJZ23_01810 [Candidatus Parcubacteria bacterium]|nr:hypothetical protein [Candidatus Parcubacteria bacterium]